MEPRPHFTTLDADRCAAEPIHLPGAIQPHGALVVFEPASFRVLQASANATDLLGVDPFDADVAMAGVVTLLRDALDDSSTAVAVTASGMAIGARSFEVALHRGPQGILAEFEPASGAENDTINALHPRVRAFVDRAQAAPEVVDLCAIAATEVRALSGFDRVMVYRFDRDWHGMVIAEDRNSRLPSYLDLRFPAGDIPVQARALYRRHRLRLIPDAAYVPQPIAPAASPLDGRPLDLSAAGLRSVSPVHLEYMRNMGTAASMSISILIDGELWGLIACHHAAPRVLGPKLRAACDFLGQLLSMQLGTRERASRAGERLALTYVERELLAHLARASSVPNGLAERPEVWLQLTHATGAAVAMEGSVLTAGRAPNPEQVKALVGWLEQRPDTGAVFSTQALASLYPPAAAYAEVGSGLLAVSISALHPHFILWFRPEVVDTVRWGGAPDKLEDTTGALHPRRSFALWSEEVRGKAEDWRPAEIESAESFMSAVVSFVLKRAEERAGLTQKLENSHRELEAFSYSVSHDLRAPFRHVVAYAQLLREREDQFDETSRHYLGSIIESATAAGQLVDDLLNFSQLGRAPLDLTAIDMAKLVTEIRQSVALEARERPIEWRIGVLPVGYGDASLIRQAFGALIDNAIRCTAGRDPQRIEVAGEERAHETVYTVTDNGIGFEMADVGKVFGVFQRLHRPGEFEGTGVGLALARRIVDRHGGWIAAEGELNRGATFRFGLPRRPA